MPPAVTSLATVAVVGIHVQTGFDVIHRQTATDLFVPREMREKYVLRDGSTIDGRATYAKFRRYQVTVDTTVK